MHEPYITHARSAWAAVTCPPPVPFELPQPQIAATTHTQRAIRRSYREISRRESTDRRDPRRASPPLLVAARLKRREIAERERGRRDRVVHRELVEDRRV